MSPHGLVLAWMLAKSRSVIAIPGVRRIESAVDSAKAAEVQLSGADLAAVEAAIA